MSERFERWTNTMKSITLITSKMFSKKKHFVPYKYKSLIISVGNIRGSYPRNKHNVSIAHKSY